MAASTIVPDPEIRASVLRLYERARAESAQPFDADRFLAFLTQPPTPNGRRVSDTFAGRRRFVRFMHSVQEEFGVCFTTEEWKAGFTLDGFVERVATKKSKPDVARRLATKRLAEARVALVDAPIKFGLITLPLLIGAITVNYLFVRIFLAFVWLAIMGAILFFTINDYQSVKRLLKRIE